MGKTEKSAGSISVIGGADGPTSFFVGGKHKKTIKQRAQTEVFRIRQARIGKYLKADPHSMVEVMEYIKDKYGFAEVDRCSEEYREQYEQMRASFLMQYAPGLLGEYADVPQLTSRDEEGIRNFMEQLSIRQKRTESVSREVFDIDFHIFKKEQDSTRMDFVVESKYGYIGGEFCGSGKTKRKYEKMYRDVYRYYGVSKEDIEHKTKRWKDVVRTLARR